MCVRHRNHFSNGNHSVSPHPAGVASLKHHHVDFENRPQSESLIQFKNQTTNFGAAITKYIDRSSEDEDLNGFLKRLPLLLGTQLVRIKRHQPESERYELLVHMTQTLSSVTPSDAASGHPVLKLLMSTFITTKLQPAANAMGPNSPRNQALKAGFEHQLPRHEAASALHPGQSIRRHIELTFNRKLPNLPGKCISIVKAIGASPLTAKEKTQLIGDLFEKLQEMINPDFPLAPISNGSH